MNFNFYVVGVGGTGSLLARDLPKLLIGTDHIITLIDGDTVERNNMKRQSYQEHDIGENKAISLSKKINTFYSTNCFAVDQYVTKENLVELINKKASYIPVIIGCVDNNKTRKILEFTVKKVNQCIYIDSANSEFEGNIYVAIKHHKLVKGPLRSKVYKLKNDKHPSEISCQEQAAKGNVQYLVTNNKMASVLLEHIQMLLMNDLRVGVTSVKRLEEVHY